MYKYALIPLLLLFAVNTDVGAKPKKKKVETDTFILYRVAGRIWQTKRTPKPGNEGGDTSTSFEHFEVMDVYKDEALIRSTSLGMDRKQTASKGMDITIKFEKDNFNFGTPPAFNKQTKEKVKVPAGSFLCIRYISKDGSMKMWKSTQFPGLMVKSDNRFGTTELESLLLVPGDPGFKAKKKKRKKKKKDGDEAEEVDQFKLFKSNGTIWAHRTRISSGKNKRFHNAEIWQSEIVKVSDEQAKLEIIRLTAVLKPMKGIDEKTEIIKFDDNFEDLLKPSRRAAEERIEKRIVKAGYFECIVYSYKDEDGNAAKAWYAKEWPGLLVRKLIETDAKDTVVELVMFEE